MFKRKRYVMIDVIIPLIFELDKNLIPSLTIDMFS